MEKPNKQLYKVIHVELIAPYKGRKHYYFGSQAAIYELLPEEVVGVKLESLWNIDISGDNEYKNKLCTIRSGVLKRKPTNRGGFRKGGQDESGN